MLGHASAAMTLDTYADLFDDDLDYVAQALSQARNLQRTITVAGQRPGDAMLLPALEPARNDLDR